MVFLDQPAGEGCSLHSPAFGPAIFFRNSSAPIDPFILSPHLPRQVQIVALCSFFKISLRVVYLDQSAGDKCNVHFIEPDTSSTGAQCTDTGIQLLYRPGHYDILYA